MNNVRVCVHKRNGSFCVKNSRAVAAGLVLAVRRPPDVQAMKKA